MQYVIYGNSANKRWIESVQCTFQVFNRGRLNYSQVSLISGEPFYVCCRGTGSIFVFRFGLSYSKGRPVSALLYDVMDDLCFVCLGMNSKDMFGP